MHFSSSTMRAPPAPAEQLTSAMASIQQSFTSEASAILTAAVSDASRRHHPHVTPVHVAAALLSAPSSLLHRSCMMHQEQYQHRPMHPFLSCRALDLCFSVALDRIASIPSHSSSPIFSNALVASLKRAQAIQRRGSPDHPLLAIRVDLPHLTISILDDPSVSRVMGEAGFSSPRVKSSILSYINPKHIHGREIGLAVSSYRQEIKRVADVLMRQQKRNPVLVGDSGVDYVMEDILGMMRRGEFGNLNVISVGASLSRAKTNELPGMIRGIVNTVSFKLLHAKGVVLDLGDLKWLVEAQHHAVLPKHTMEERRQTLIATARSVISEVASILRQERRMWVIGTATCATYLKCQVYHPNMERDWDLQALPITPRSLVGVLPSFVGKGIPGSSVEALNTSNDHASSINIYGVPLNWHPAKTSTALTGSPGLCSLGLKQHTDESSCIVDMHQLEQYNSRRGLNWLLNCPLAYQKEEFSNERTIEVGDKSQGPCSKLQGQLELVPTSPGSNSSTGYHQSHSEPTVQTDLSLRLAPFSATKLSSGPCGDAESQLSLSERLSREVHWQQEAALSIASAVQGFKSGTRKRYGSENTAIWLLFNGPDDIGKRKMAHALSMLVFREKPATFNLSPRRDSTSPEQSIPDCGRTQLDLLVEAVSANPMRVIVLNGIDQANATIRTTIKNAIMTGRFVDFDGQGIGGLGDTIFVLVVGSEQDEKEMQPLTWHLELSVGPNTRKRRAEYEQHDERRNKPRTVSQPLSLDLNLCAGSCSSAHDDDDNKENDDGDSDLTEEINGHNIGQCTEPFPVPPSISEIYHLLDQVTDFKPFNLGEFKLNLSKIMSAKFASAMGAPLHLEIETHVLDRIADVLLHGDGGISSFDQWVDKVFVPVVEQLKSSASLKDEDKISLSVVKGQQLSWTTSGHGTQLPISVTMRLDAT